MKTNSKLPVYLSVMTVIFLLFVTSCKKTEESLTVTDKDGNVYNTIKIGTQVWFKENLKTTKYNDGSAIPNVTLKSQWDNLATDAYCWYNNDANTHKETYGALYNWYAVNTGKLCPTGWHVPTDAEWSILTDLLGDLNYAGGKLKEKSTSHWIDPNLGASDDYGFRALPAGDRYPAAGFEFWGLGEYCAIWSSTERDATHAYYREIYNNSERIYEEATNIKFGFSVRCIKN